jgi:sodium-dependent dicarboxylate transporter 2/3/5
MPGAPRPFENDAHAHHQTGEPASRSIRLVWMLRLAGLAAAALVWLLLDGSEGLTEDARRVAAIATLMAMWWMTEAVPLSATSLLPIVLIPALTERTVAQTTAPYANPVVFLFLGGFLIAIAMEKWNLHRRVALWTISRVGFKPRQMVLGVMLATGFISMWVSNTATTLMMLPIALSMLVLVAEHSDRAPAEQLRRFAICITLSVAWSATMGGLGTLLGSPPNAIVAGYAASELGRDIGFLEWMAMGMPLAFVFILVAWWLMTRVLYRFELDAPPDGGQMIHAEIARLGPLSLGEKMVILVFASAAFLWIVPPLLASVPTIGARFGWLRTLDDSAVAIAAGIALFLLPASDTGGRRGMVLEWRDAERGLPWGVLLLFGGGLSLAGAIAGTGLDHWFGLQVRALGALPPILLVAAVSTLVLFLTEITSNTASAATFIPVLGAVALGIDADPIMLLIPATLAATCAFMLPVGTPPNAIVFGTGRVTIGQMARGGLVLNLIGIVLITAACYLLGGWAMGIDFGAG